jgi:hypothetical protein
MTAKASSNTPQMTTNAVYSGFIGWSAVLSSLPPRFVK